MSAEILLARLEKVRKTGRDSWVACCPAHADKTPSLTVRELDDGRVLAHCFAGCGIDEILSSAGLSMDELFPEKLEHGKPQRRPFNPSDVLRLIGKESLIVAATAKTLTQRKLSAIEQNRVMESAIKIQGALQAAGIEVQW